MDTATTLFAVVGWAAAGYSWLRSDRIRAVLRQYAGSAVARRAPGKPGSSRGRETTATVFFTDMKSFTEASEALGPEKTALLLKMVLGPALDAIRKSGGTVDKIIGDAVMYRHCDALSGLSMLESVHETIEKSAKKAAQYIGCQQPTFTTGIHTGDIYICYLGAKGGLVDFTILGDTVNTASRIQSLTSKYGFPALISGDTFRAAGMPEAWKLLDIVQVKNRKAPVDLYVQPTDQEAWTAFEEARIPYAKGQFSEAAAMFDKIGLKMWADRARLLEKNPPAQWSTVWAWATKN